MPDSQRLLAEYAETGSEVAFRELVTRYIDLVYSAAVRLVNGDTHLAEDVAQTVFVDLSRQARNLSREVMLGGWLHRHTCFVASKLIRGERRRRKREEQAVAMNALEDHSETSLASVAPILDDAINQLRTEDRRAILLRFFEQQDFRSVGEALGSNEDAARKRVGRALEKLHLLLGRRGVALSIGGLATALGAEAVTAAPAGLAVGITTAALASGATSASVGLTVFKFMSMAKLKMGLVTVLVAAGVAIPWTMQRRAQSELRAANESLRQQSDTVNALAAENRRLSNLLARATSSSSPGGGDLPELLKLRAEVAKLRQQVASAPAATVSKADNTSTLEGLTSKNPEVRKLIRDQQKAGMTVVYKDFINLAKLSKEQAEKLNELLADNVMENIDHITAILRDKKSPQEMEQLLAAQESTLTARVQALLGPEEFARYQDYNRDLLSHLTAEQFKAVLGGESAESQAKQLYKLVQEESQIVLANAGLSADFQLIPVLNFRNIASEEEAEKNLQRLTEVYERVAARAGSFLGPDELQKFAEFRANAISGNRASLVMNRKMMEPLSK